ncbi:MAG: glycogen synthase GlgA [Ignavibacteria bacterium]|nr:glycogen synthase GlgA [Ignavibacteria bacterium]
MKIAFVASEVFPYAKTGGLADVAGTLPKELEKLGHDLKVFMPKYNTFDEAEHGLHYQWDLGGIPVRVANRVHFVHVHKALLPNSNVEIYFIDCPHFFHRFKIYTSDSDEGERFVLFSKGVIEVLQRLQWAPNIIHCNDWQAGLIPALVKENYNWDRMFDATSFVLTIHNIAYQGRFAKSVFESAELKFEHSQPGGAGEFEGGVSFLKMGILFSEKINTVSETYAKELLTPEYGAGMEGFIQLRKNDLSGILNGIDYHIWDPETDKLLPYKYSANDFSGKLENKKFLLKHLQLPFSENIPLIGIVSRMVVQKGFDIFADAANELLKLDAQWVILGSGEQIYEDLFTKFAHFFPQKVVVYLGFNNELAHLIEAGSDIFLMPSRYEPCGLNQLYSLKYGTVPVVRKTGGLADTVLDWNEFLTQGLEIGTGYSFGEYSGKVLLHSVQRAVNDFRLKEVWRKIQLNGMNKDYSWGRSAKKYVVLYNQAKRQSL